MRRAALAIIATIAGLVGLLTFKTHGFAPAAVPAAIATTGPGADTASGSTGTAPPTSASSGPASPTPRSSASTGAAAKTVTGNAVDTRWGPVQVRITVTDGKLSNVTVVEYPSGNPRDLEINSTAIPALIQEAKAAGNAKIDMISGATYTSQGYIGSLQSALDKAGL